MWAGLCSLLEALRENPLPRLCQLPEASMLFGSWPSSSNCKASNGRLNPLCIYHTNLHPILPPPSTSKDPCGSIGPIWVIQEDLHLKISVGTACAMPCANVAPGSRKASHTVRWQPGRMRLHWVVGGVGLVSESRAEWPGPEALEPGLHPPGPGLPQ